MSAIALGLGTTVPAEWYEAPAFYFSNPAAVIGPGQDVAAPSGSNALDFELEVGIVIGHPGVYETAEKAIGAVAGLVILNDWSARDLQLTERRLGLGLAKSKDFATSIGPWLVTIDELDDYRTGGSFDLAMAATVNGRLYSKASLGDLHYSIGEMVAYAARDTTLVPGDVIGTGTCGTGCILELSLTHGAEAYPWLTSGDLVELEVAGLGLLRNSIVTRGLAR
jgi:fumarylacetoacetate (FAA) hydrolase